jgi:hypothetical protein
MRHSACDRIGTLLGNFETASVALAAQSAVVARLMCSTAGPSLVSSLIDVKFDLLCGRKLQMACLPSAAEALVMSENCPSRTHRGRADPVFG